MISLFLHIFQTAGGGSKEEDFGLETEATFANAVLA